MKKFLLVAAAAAGVGGYFYQNSAQAGTNLLTQIPADAVLFSYQTSSTNSKNYINSTVAIHSDEQLKDLFKTKLTPEQTFVVKFLDSYIEKAKTFGGLQDFLGVGNEFNSVFYSLGMIPVGKLQLADFAKFWQTIDQLEKDAGVSRVVKKLGDVEYRRYELGDSDFSLGLVFAVVDDVFTFTLDVPALGTQNPLKMALGLEKPAQNIQADNRLAKLSAKYSQARSFLVFDHQEVVKGVTTLDGNLFAKQLAELKKREKKFDFKDLQTSACQNEYAAIAANWPRTVVYGKNDSAKIAGGVVFESNNKVIINALQSMRGVLANSAEPSILNFALGLDVGKVGAAVTTIWSDFLTPKYQCQSLANMQADLAKDNPAQYAMFTSMANGLQGVSLELFDFVRNSAGKKSLDGLVSISSANPSVLLQMGQMFVPELAKLQVKPNNQPVEVTNLLANYVPFSNKFFVRMNDRRITLYGGTQADAAGSKLMAQTAETKGIFSAEIDSEKALAVAQKIETATGEKVPTDVADLLQGSASGSITFDVNENGIVVEFAENITSKAK